MKKITIIVPYDIWAAARKKMVTDGNSLQGLLSRALTEYVEGGMKMEKIPLAQKMDEFKIMTDSEKLEAIWQFIQDRKNIAENIGYAGEGYNEGAKRVINEFTFHFEKWFEE